MGNLPILDTPNIPSVCNPHDEASGYDSFITPYLQTQPGAAALVLQIGKTSSRAHQLARYLTAKRRELLGRALRARVRDRQLGDDAGRARREQEQAVGERD